MLTAIRRSIKQQKGFTFMELVIVIAIIGILAAIAVPNLLGSTANARGARIVADLRSIDSAIGMAIANGKTPATGAVSADANVSANLASVPTPPTGAAKGPSGSEYDVKSTDTYQISQVGTGYRATLLTKTAEQF
jgi:general secretion pathway protein G